MVPPQKKSWLQRLGSHMPIVVSFIGWMWYKGEWDLWAIIGLVSGLVMLTVSEAAWCDTNPSRRKPLVLSAIAGAALALVAQLIFFATEGKGMLHIPWGVGVVMAMISFAFALLFSTVAGAVFLILDRNSRSSGIPLSEQNVSR